MAEGRTACVIGAGFGGLALAIRLQSAGIATTVIEGRDKPGAGGLDAQSLGQAGQARSEARSFLDPIRLCCLFHLGLLP